MAQNQAVLFNLSKGKYSLPDNKSTGSEWLATRSLPFVVSTGGKVNIICVHCYD